MELTSHSLNISCKQTDLKIPWEFPFSEDDLSDDERLRMMTVVGEWTDSPATFEWFRARGYTLFQRNTTYAREDFPYPSDFIPRLPYPPSEQADYPFPHHIRRLAHKEKSDRDSARVVS